MIVLSALAAPARPLTRPASLAVTSPDPRPGSFRALLRDTREQCANFCLPVPAVPAERTYGSQLPGLGPPRDGLRVNPEHGRDLCWGQQRLGLWCACRHVDGLSSWTGTAILRLFCSWLPRGACRGCPIWSTQTILPSPAVTSRPPGAKCFSALRHVAPLIRVTLRDSSDTQRRNGQIRKSHPPLPSASLLDGLQFAPPGAQPLVHGGCQLKLPASQGTHGGGYLSYRLVRAERVVIE